jgi:hypothetical protein
VDQKFVDSSFTAETGRIAAIGTLKVDNLKNYARANLYSISFSLEDDLPKAGYLEVRFPQSMRLTPSTT